MEQNTSMVAKKIWNIMRIAFLMLRKGICKRKILMDLNLVMKRGKIAGKALQNLMLQVQHQHQHQSSDPGMSTVGQSSPPGEYEFSCSDTPLYRHYFTNNKRKKHSHFFMPSPFDQGMNTAEAINIFDMLMLNGNTGDAASDAAASPALSGLGPELSPPAVKQLRITDSPFSVQSNSEDCNNHVDEAAEDFINKFYSQLKNQS